MSYHAYMNETIMQSMSGILFYVKISWETARKSLLRMVWTELLLL